MEYPKHPFNILSFHSTKLHIKIGFTIVQSFVICLYGDSPQQKMTEIKHKQRKNVLKVFLICKNIQQLKHAFHLLLFFISWDCLLHSNTILFKTNLFDKKKIRIWMWSKNHRSRLIMNLSLLSCCKRNKFKLKFCFT